MCNVDIKAAGHAGAGLATANWSGDSQAQG